MEKGGDTMKKTVKRFIFIATLVLVLFLTTSPVRIHAAEILESGTAGTIMWSLSSDGTLRLSGEGEMEDYKDYREPSPWIHLSEKIRKVVIEEGITGVGKDAFYMCKNLTEVSLPNGLQSIGGFAFIGTGITEITLPDSLRVIDGYAFQGIEITQIVFPNGLEYIGPVAFAGCQNLTQISIPASVTNLASDAFQMCYGIRSFNVDSNNPVYSSVGGVLYTKDQTTLLRAPCAVENPVILDTVREILPSAFDGCKKITEITIPEGIRKIEMHTFQDCENLQKVTFPNSLQHIDSQAFLWCDLREIIIPKNVKEIRYLAFQCCDNLSKVTFEGDAPTMGMAVAIDIDGSTVVEESHFEGLDFGKFTTVYYPAHNATWTEEAKQQVVSNVTWVEYGHEWSGGTCTTAQKCSVCGKTEGTAPGHQWENATCTAPKTCSVCGTTEGAAPGHQWENATCTTPKTCAVCGTTEGKVKPHSWEEATCATPKICTVCGASEGKPTAHSWDDATCTLAKSCSKCGVTEGSATGHDWVEASCNEQKKCRNCGKKEGGALGHNWAEGSCTEPKTCTQCGKTAGKAHGHKWKTASCKDPQTCLLCGATEGKPSGHNWKAANCVSPKRCITCNTTEGEKGEHKCGIWTVDSAPTTERAGFRHRNCTFCELELEREELPALKSGKVENYTDEAQNDYSGQIEHTEDELTEKLLTPAEKERVEQGEQVAVSVTLEDISITVAEEDQVLIAEKLGENVVGLYLDVTVIKQVGNDEPQIVTQTNSAITVTIEVPQELKNEDTSIERVYKVIRNHEGQIAILDATYDAATGKITFETDSFSTYALIYSDVEVKENPIVTEPSSEPQATTMPVVNSSPAGDQPNGGETEKQEDQENSTAVWVLLISVLICVGIASYVIIQKRKHQ